MKLCMEFGIDLPTGIEMSRTKMGQPRIFYWTGNETSDENKYAVWEVKYDEIEVGK